MLKLENSLATTLGSVTFKSWNNAERTK